MHIIAWLMSQKAWQRGEIATDSLDDPKYRLGPAAQTDEAVLAIMPAQAKHLVEESQSLYDRVLRLQQRMEAAFSARRSVAPVQPTASPALELLGRLEKSL
jgi:regulator of CtrA degradation